jgi:hypothetical protein
MSRIVAFGCSFSYGHYLDDPNTQAWPAILGKLLNVSSINKSRNGASNLEILTNILKFNFKPDDIVVVGWTFIYRDMIYNRWKSNTQINGWSDQEKFDTWSSIHNSYDLAVRAGLQISHASLHLASLGLKPSSWINKSIISYEDYANDNMHPGINSHVAAATRLYNIINET